MWHISPAFFKKDQIFKNYFLTTEKQLACFTVNQLEDERATGDDARSSGQKVPEGEKQVKFNTTSNV